MYEGADVDARDVHGNTPLHDSCKYPAFIILLYFYYIFILLVSVYSLFDSQRQFKFSVSARLVAFHANLNLQGGDGLTPLALAICGNDDDTVALLMSNGAN